VKKRTPKQSSFAQHDSTENNLFRLVAPNSRRLGAKLITKYVLSFLQLTAQQACFAVRQEHKVAKYAAIQ
jgi:hypothetical protein